MNRLLLMLAGAVALGACGAGSSDTVGDELTGRTASLKLSLVAGAGFAGRSAMICAAREQPADAKYPCANEMPCSCFSFDAAGQSTPDGAPVSIDGLCPSSDVPVANWRFDYTLFSDDVCTPSAAMTSTDTTLGVVCYELADLGARLHPNSSIETLESGDNASNIICITR